MGKVANNVVRFPVIPRKIPAQSMQEVFNSIEEIRKDHIDIIVDESIKYLMYRIMQEGYDVGDPKVMKSQFLLEEAMKSLMLHAVDIDYPIQELAEDIFDFEQEEKLKEENDNESQAES